ncbi:hypothetical protein D3C81_1689550 [compost metagenome]
MSSNSTPRSRASALPRPSTWTGASMTFCRALMCGNRLKLWNTMPILPRTRRMWLSGARTSWPPRWIWVRDSPSTSITPLSMVSRVISARSRVDLPEPLGPMIATFSLAFTSRLRSLSTVKLP